MDHMERILAELLSDFNTVETKRRTYKQILDDIISTTSAVYVTKATEGFFPDKTQPAFMCLRCAVHLLRAAQHHGPAQVEALKAALADLDRAMWDGVDMNTGKLKPNFRQLRWDKDSRGEDEFNNKVAELYNYSGDMFEQARASGGVADVENIFTAIAQLATVVSTPKAAPMGFTEEECNEAPRKAESMIKFALKVAEGRR